VEVDTVDLDMDLDTDMVDTDILSPADTDTATATATAQRPVFFFNAGVAATDSIAQTSTQLLPPL
jgi:hypothetical protein